MEPPPSSRRRDAAPRKRWSFHSGASAPRALRALPRKEPDGARRGFSARGRTGLGGRAECEVEVRVRQWVLEGNGSGLRKHSRFGAWRKKVEPYKTVRVAANPGGLAPTCLYASDVMFDDAGAEPYKLTEFITSRREYVEKESVVYRDSAFEIGVVGMSVASKDFGIGSAETNELVMYSMQRDAEGGGEGDDLPYIHYDPTKEERGGGSRPDEFIPIPASKSLFLTSDGKAEEEEWRRSVNVRFKVLELDQVDDGMAKSLSGIEELGNQVEQFAAAAPLLGLLSPAVALASTVSRRALESHARPDRVLTIDMNFLLAARGAARADADADGGGAQEAGRAAVFERRSGEFLRYGYYFFLEKRVEARLYASFRTFPHVALMLRRTDAHLRARERRYFPLTGVSYLVLRVSARATAPVARARSSRRAIRLAHVQRLDDVLRACAGGRAGAGGGDDDDARAVVRALGALARDLGIGAAAQRERP